MRVGTSAAAVLVALALGAAGPAFSGALAVDGTDVARVRLPPSVIVEGYENAGYRLTVEDDGTAVVTVDAAPLASEAPFRPLRPPARGRSEDAVTRLARAVTADVRSRYEAVSRILGWVAANLRYDLDRSLPQDAVTVLERRSAYCTGIARTTVALLESVGITAREVPGYVAGHGAVGEGAYHRWVEVYYPDRGWVFSDPLATHHYVPASYVRLADEELLAPPDPGNGVLLERRDGRRVVDVYPAAPEGVTARRNVDRQLASTLEVRAAVDGGTAVLEGRGRRWVQPLGEGGRATFVGLQPGSYLLRVERREGAPMEKRITFQDRVRGEVELGS